MQPASSRSSLSSSRLLILSEIPGLAPLVKTRLDQEYPHVELLTGLESIGRAQILLADPSLLTSEVLASASSLLWVQSTWAGVNSLFQPGKRRDYLLTRCAGCFGPLMAEYVLGNILSRERGICEWKTKQQQKQWDSEFKFPRRLSKLTIGLLGVGEIGKDVAKVCKAFNMRVVGYRLSEDSNASLSSLFDELVSGSVSRLPAFLSQCDYVVNILPSTSKTRGLLSDGVLRNCKPTAVFINIGRGDVIDEGSLIDALQLHRYIAAAVLDVFQIEPLPDTSPLWTLPNVLVTPHISGTSYPDDVAEVFFRNLPRFLTHSKDMCYVVDWQREY